MEKSGRGGEGKQSGLGLGFREELSEKRNRARKGKNGIVGEEESRRKEKKEN